MSKLRRRFRFFVEHATTDLRFMFRHLRTLCEDLCHQTFLFCHQKPMPLSELHVPSDIPFLAPDPYFSSPIYLLSFLLLSSTF